MVLILEETKKNKETGNVRKEVVKDGEKYLSTENYWERRDINATNIGKKD